MIDLSLQGELKGLQCSLLLGLLMQEVLLGRDNIFRRLYGLFRLFLVSDCGEELGRIALVKTGQFAYTLRMLPDMLQSLCCKII